MADFKRVRVGARGGVNRIEDKVTVTLAELRAIGVRKTRLRPSDLVDRIPGKHERRRWREQRYNSLYSVVGGDLCVYCGSRAELLDHVPPLSQVYLADIADPFLLYPACWVCNDILGADRRVCLHLRAEVVAVALGKKLPPRMAERLAMNRVDQHALHRRVGRMLVDGDFADICQCRQCRRDRAAVDEPQDPICD